MKIDKESMLETLDILSDPQTMRDIAEALEDVELKRFRELK